MPKIIEDEPVIQWEDKECVYLFHSDKPDFRLTGVFRVYGRIGILHEEYKNPWTVFHRGCGIRITSLIEKSDAIRMAEVIVDRKLVPDGTSMFDVKANTEEWVKMWVKWCQDEDKFMEIPE